jgi:hypothetical protein
LKSLQQRTPARHAPPVRIVSFEAFALQNGMLTHLFFIDESIWHFASALQPA